MKKLIFLIIIILPFIVKGQAHLGSTEKDIRDAYPDKTFTVGYNDDGQKYISAFMYYGIFIYYFDKESGHIKFLHANN